MLVDFLCEKIFCDVDSLLEGIIEVLLTIHSFIHPCEELVSLVPDLHHHENDALVS